MNMKSLIRITIATGILIAPLAQAHAYQLTFSSKTEHSCTARPVVNPEQVEVAAALSAR